MSQLRYFIVYKPYNMLSQFTQEGPDDITLRDLGKLPPDVYPVGRLDKDSEGLLILTNDKALNQRLLNPQHAHEREYWVQVEGIPTEEALKQLRQGVTIQDYKTKATQASIIPEPQLPERNPPIRFRKNIPTTWLSLSLIEGKNRQVRRMTAAVGFPTLRLVRSRMEGIKLGSMQPGEIKEMKRDEVYGKLFRK